MAKVVRKKLCTKRKKTTNKIANYSKEFNQRSEENIANGEVALHIVLVR